VPVDSVAGAEVADSGTADGFIAAGGVTSTVFEHPDKMHETSRKHINDCRTVNSVVWFSMCRGHEPAILRLSIVGRKFNALRPKSKCCIRQQGLSRKMGLAKVPSQTRFD